MKSHNKWDLFGSLFCSICFLFSGVIWSSESSWTGFLLALTGIAFAAQYVGMKRENNKAVALAERAFKAVDKQVKNAKV